MEFSINPSRMGLASFAYITINPLVNVELVETVESERTTIILFSIIVLISFEHNGWI